MSARSADGAGEVTKAPTVEVEHPHGGVSAFGVGLVHRMPAAAVWAVEFMALFERTGHEQSIGGTCGSGGQPARWRRGATVDALSFRTACAFVLA